MEEKEKNSHGKMFKCKRTKGKNKKRNAEEEKIDSSFLVLVLLRLLFAPSSSPLLLFVLLSRLRRFLYVSALKTGND